MSLWREIVFKCVIKEEYREFFNSVIIENDFEYECDEKILNDFMKELEYFTSNGRIFIMKERNQVCMDGFELPIYNKATGQCNMRFEYNLHGSFSHMIYLFEHELLPYIIEGEMEYLYYWNETMDWD